MAEITSGREADIAALAQGQFDVLVIGGGITGAGILLEAVSRGYRAALVEKSDFASATSSASSKLIHGGLRYLAQGDIGLVHESLRERALLLHNAPGIVRPLDFVIPLSQDGYWKQRLEYGTALWAYDLAAGYRVQRRHRSISSPRVKSMLPHLDTSTMKSAFLYRDAQGDDVRLTLSVIASAQERGALALNYVRAEGVSDIALGQMGAVAVASRNPADAPSYRAGFEVRTRCVVSATGIEAADFLDSGPLAIRPAQGVHLAFAQRDLPAKVGAVIGVPGESRTVFVLPWGSYTYVGTTDTDMEGSIPATASSDINYLLDALNANLTRGLRRDDITGAWVGARPLITHKAPSAARLRPTRELSRRHQIVRARSGVISALGGKLTDFRQMAQDAVNAVDTALGRKTKSVSRQMPLEGTALVQPPPKEYFDLYLRYGNRYTEVLPFLRHKPIAVGPWTLDEGEIAYFVRHEAALTLSDVLLRRLRVGIFDQAAAKAMAPAVNAVLAGMVGLTTDQVRLGQEEFLASLVRNLPNLA